jgi:UDP-GlcNAc3NAcA epimerase
MILSIIGTRPQIIKVFPLASEFNRKLISHKIIDTSQHYDDAVSSHLYKALDFKPDYFLGKKDGSAIQQIALTQIELEKKIIDLKPSIIIVYGDTNSTLAAAITAKKMQAPLMHIESGLRSHSKIQEEYNRIVVDHVSDYRIAPTKSSLENLRNEGLIENSFNLGDLMLDSFNLIKKMWGKTPPNVALPDEFILLTIHRAENTDSKDNLTKILTSIGKIPETVVLPIHHRLKINIENFKLEIPPNINIYNPFNFIELSYVLDKCKSVITDSGGLQKEAFFAKKNCITIRNQTEWAETLYDNWNIVCDDFRKLNEYLSPRTHKVRQEQFFGKGNSAELIVKKVIELGYE